MCSAQIVSVLAHKCETRLKNVATEKYDLAYFAAAPLTKKKVYNTKTSFIYSIFFYKSFIFFLSWPCTINFLRF
jgi:hypothetical protein